MTTIELAVLFAPLLFKSNNWNLNYCYKMPRIANIFELVLRKPSKVFLISKDYKQPKSIEEFLLSDHFGDLWRRFRIEDKQLINYLSDISVITASINCLLIHNSPFTPEGLQETQRAALASLFITSDTIMPVVVNSEPLLIQLFSFIEFNKQNHFSISFIRDTVEGCSFPFTFFILLSFFISYPPSFFLFLF